MKILVSGGGRAEWFDGERIDRRGTFSKNCSGLEERERDVECGRGVSVCLRMWQFSQLTMSPVLPIFYLLTGARWWWEEGVGDAGWT